MISKSSSTSSKRLILITACLTSATALVLAGKHFLRDHSSPAPAATAAQTQAEKPAATAEFLASLPAPSATTPTGRARTAAMGKLKVSASNAAAWLDLGDSLAQELRETGSPAWYPRAEKAYAEALRLAPASAEAMTGLAWVCGGRHVFDQSIAWAKRALEENPELPDAWGIIGDAELELGHYDDALEHYQKMMDLRPDLSSWSRGAHLLWIVGNKSKAMWLMERAIKAGAPYAENSAWCRAELAMMQFHDGALLPAAQTLQPALDAGTRNTRVLLTAARIETARGNTDAAKRHYQAVIETAPHLEALAALGDIQAAAGDAAGAEALYLQVEKLHATNAATGVHDHMQMAKFLADHDRNLPEALRLAVESAGTKNVQEADTLAWVYLKSGDKAKAVATMKKALSRNTPDAEMRYHAGMIAAAAGDRTSAQRHLQEALSFNSSFSLLQAPIAQKTLESLGSRDTADTK